MTTKDSAKMLGRLNWRLLLGEFIVIVVGVLLALWVDQLREARANAAQEVEYLQSLLTDVYADLAQFDEAEAWMRRSESHAAPVLALYEGRPPTDDATELVQAVETAGWQSVPFVARHTFDDLLSTGNLRLIRDPALRRAIASYYATADLVSIPMTDVRNRIWAQYDAQLANVLAPGVRLGVLQRDQSFGLGIASHALEPAAPPSVDELIAALRTAASEVLYQTINMRASMQLLRTAALELEATLKQALPPDESR